MSLCILFIIILCIYSGFKSFWTVLDTIASFIHLFIKRKLIQFSGVSRMCEPGVTNYLVVLVQDMVPWKMGRIILRVVSWWAFILPRIRFMSSWSSMSSIMVMHRIKLHHTGVKVETLGRQNERIPLYLVCVLCQSASLNQTVTL